MTNYNKELISVLKRSEYEAFVLNHPFVGTEHFILGILSTDNELKQCLSEIELTYDKYRNELIRLSKSIKNYNRIIYTPLLKKILLNSKNKNLQTIFMDIIEEGEGIGISIINNLDIDISSLYRLLKNSKTNNYGINLNKLAIDKKLNKLIGRKQELNEVIEILGRKNKCNPLLIGEAGVGKTAIVEGLTYKIINNEVPNYLKGNTILSLSMSSIVSGTKYRGEFEEKLERIIDRISKDKKIILFIDEIHTIIGAGGAEGAIDASNILKPYLARNDIKCIGATTIAEYNKSIKKDKALDRRFSIITIKEPNNNELKEILYTIKEDYERYHNISIGCKELDYIINCAKKLSNRKEPDRSIELLDKICTKASIHLKNNYTIKYNNEYNVYKNNKESCLKNNDFSSANIYRKKESIAYNRIANYKPKISISYIKSLTNNYSYVNNIGFIKS